MHNSYPIKALLLTFWFLIIYVDNYAQKNDMYSKPLYVQSYRLDDQGAIVRCYEIAEDANGCIMTVTSSGLKIYDGSKWVNYSNYSKLDLLQHININQHNNIFVCGQECLGYFRPEIDGNLKFHSCEVPFTIRDVQKIVNSDDNKTIYVLPDGIFISDSEMVFKSIENVIASAECSLGLILLCKNGNLYCYSKESLQNLGNLGYEIDNAIMTALDNNKLLVLCSNFSAYQIDFDQNNQTEPLSNFIVDKVSLYNPHLDHCKINDISYSAKMQRLAVSTNNGIVIYSNQFKYIQTIDRTLNLPVNNISNVFFDSKGNLWASYSGGISRIEFNFPYVCYYTNQGITDPVLSSFTDGQYVYAGTASSIFVSAVDSAQHNNSFTPLKYDNAEEQNFCWDFVNVDGILLACTTCGIYQVTPTKVIRKALTGNTYGATTSPFYPGKLFVSGYDGLTIFDYQIHNGQIFFNETTKQKHSIRPLFKIKVSDDGIFWCSTLYDGIVKIEAKNKQLDSIDVEYLNIANGLQRINNLTLEIIGTSIYVNDGLFKHAIIDSEEKHLMFEPVYDLNSVFDPNEIVYHYVYNKPTNEFFVFTQKAFHRINVSNPENSSLLHFRQNVETVYALNLIDSTLLFSTNCGIIQGNIYDTIFNTSAHEPFNVLINDISCNGNTIFSGIRYFEPHLKMRTYNVYTKQNSEFSFKDTTFKIECNYTNNHILIKFSATAFENVESVTYRTKLVGLDTSWGNWLSTPFKEYLKIPYGNYQFLVQARNFDGIESSIASFNFTIVPPFYATTLAIVFYILIISLFIFLLIKKVTHQLKTRNTSLENIVSEHTLQLQQQNEKLRQMSFVATRSTNSVIIMDKDGVIIWTNDSFKNIYGCSFEEFIYIYGNNYFDSYLSNDTKNKELIELARKTSQNVTYEIGHRYFNDINWVQASLDTVFDDDGKLCNWILTETDITMLKRAQAEGARQQSELTEAFMRLQENQLQIEVQREQLYLKNLELEKGYKKIETQNNAITNSIRYAQQMQKSILPLDESISPFFDHFVIYLPKDLVSGDFYWFEPLPDGSLIFVVADCTGHGVPGAFMSLIGYNLLNEIILIQDITQPKQIFEKLSQGLISVLKQERNQNYDGMEVRLCRFVPNDDGYNVTFCGTGSSIFYYNNATDQMQRIKGVHRHLGLNDETIVNNDFEEHCFEFKPGDKLYMITDGLVDQNNPERKRFGTERFVKIVTNYRTHSVINIGNTLLAELKSFMNGQPQRDDITIVGLEIKR